MSDVSVCIGSGNACDADAADSDATDTDSNPNDAAAGERWKPIHKRVCAQQNIIYYEDPKQHPMFRELNNPIFLSLQPRAQLCILFYYDILTLRGGFASHPGVEEFFSDVSPSQFVACLAPTLAACSVLTVQT